GDPARAEFIRLQCRLEREDETMRWPFALAPLYQRRLSHREANEPSAFFGNWLPFFRFAGDAGGSGNPCGTENGKGNIWTPVHKGSALPCVFQWNPQAPQQEDAIGLFGCIGIRFSGVPSLVGVVTLRRSSRAYQSRRWTSGVGRSCSVSAPRWRAPAA